MFWKRKVSPTDGEDFKNNVEKTSKQRDPFLKYKIFKQISLICIWICLGLYLEITGPSLPDLRDRIGVDLEQMSQALISISVGIFFGCVAGGVLHERFYRHSELILALSLATAAVSTTLVPHSGSLGLVALFFLINGATEGLINTGGNTMVMHMWGAEAPAPMHSLHFGFGLGAVIAPQLVQPFMAPRNQTRPRASALNALFHLDSEEQDSVNTLATNITTAKPVQRTGTSRIEFAYLIVGIVTMCVAILWLCIYIRGPPRGFPRRQGSPKLSRKMFSPATWARGDCLMGGLIVLILFFYFVQVSGGQKAYGRFLFTFLVESDLKFSNTDAANLNSLFWGSFTVGRATGIPLAKWVPTPIMIAVQVVVILITCFILALFVFQHRVIIWVFSVPLGYFMAQTFPSGMAWANIYLDMNSVAVMLLFLGASGGGILYQYLSGYLLKNFGQTALMYIMLAYAVGLIACFVIMTLLARIYKKRNPVQDSHVTVVSPTNGHIVQTNLKEQHVMTASQKEEHISGSKDHVEATSHREGSAEVNRTKDLKAMETSVNHVQ